MYSYVKSRLVINFSLYTYVWIIISNNFALSRYKIQYIAVWFNRINMYVFRCVRHRDFGRCVEPWVYVRVSASDCQGIVHAETIYFDVSMCTHIDTLWDSNWRHESQRGIWNLFLYSHAFESSCRRWRSPRVSNFHLRYRFLFIMMAICSRQSLIYWSLVISNLER